MFERILELIKSHDTIILHRHTRPDGDAMGSQMGMKHLLQENFPEKTVYAVGDDPRSFRFMAPSGMDEIPDSAYEGALAIILDCGSASLISDSRYTLAAATARIDHHIFAGEIADAEVIDTSFESCCGMVAEFAQESGLHLTPMAAQAIYTGIVTDSGRFRYDGTSPRTHRLAAWLLEQKFDTTQLYRDLYSDTYESKKLKAYFIMKIQFTPNNIAYFYTTRQELEELKIDFFTASRGMVNLMADMKGVEIWANFTENEEGKVACELRSSVHTICPIAVKHGGGGHAKACGCTVENRKAARILLEELDKFGGSCHE